jgi:hypothetical protein
MVIPVPAKARVYADPTGLPVGTYSSSIIVGDSPAGITIPVTLKVIPNDLIIPHVTDGGGWHTEITLVNTDDADAPFTLKFRQADGTPLILPVYSVGFVSEFTDVVPAGGTLTYQTANWDPAVSQGWGELIPGGSIGASATVHLQGASSETAATVPVEPPIGKRFLMHFDNTDSIQTDLMVVNSGSSPATVSLTLHDENGNPVVTDSIELPPYGERDLQLRDSYPQLINQRGVAEFKSSSDLTTALGLRSNLQGGLASSNPVVPPPLGGDTVTRTVAQVVDGNGWKTAFTLINPGLRPVPFTVLLHDDGGGYPNSLPLHSIGEVFEYSDVVPAGGMRTFESSGASDPLAQRWAEIVSSAPIGGTVTLAQTNPDGSESDASMAIAPASGDHVVIPFDNTGGKVTALALLNESQIRKQGTVILRDESGRWLSAEYLSMNPTTDETFFLSNRFPVSDGVRGSIEFFGVQFSILGLNFSPLGSFAAVNPISK